MTPENFCYWLRGFFELSEAGGGKVEDLTRGESEMIKKHLDLVFTEKALKENTRITIPGMPTIPIGPSCASSGDLLASRGLGSLGPAPAVTC
jgi:hypothetical protein